LILQDEMINLSMWYTPDENQSSITVYKLSKVL